MLFLMNFNQNILIVFHENGTIFKNSCNFTENLVEIWCTKPNVVENWAFLIFISKIRTVRTEEPNLLKLEPIIRIQVKPVGTGTEYVLKIRTGTEEFRNRPSTTTTCCIYERMYILRFRKHGTRLFNETSGFGYAT